MAKEKYFYIVGIGTSAGGLKALQSFFNNCPDRTGMAFVVVQHLSPDYKSLMPELLSKYTNMPVAEAKNKVKVEPNKVYLIPGRKNLTIENGHLTLQNRPPIKQLNFSIDIFLESLAKEKKHLAIGVILSGTGTDGTKGTKAIKEVGGSVFAQTPESSGFDGMPKSVISHNLADYILHPQDMANEIVQYVKNPQFNYLISGTDLSHKMESINRILKVVKDNSDIDFAGYKMPTILRRTAKRLNIKKCKSIEEYIDLLYSNSAEANALAQEYLIGVTNFFRDTRVFEFLEKDVIPKIVDNAIERKQGIKMWVVACSTGEEVYSLAMLLEEYIAKLDKKVSYKIYATDIDEKALYKASKGIYSATDVKSINQDLLYKYFEKIKEGYKIILGIRQNVIISKHNVVVNPPFSRMDLVSCRNMLIYLDTEYKTQAMNAMKYALNPDGYLLLGNSETPGIFDKSFKPTNTKFRVFQNSGSMVYTPADLRNWTLDPQIKSKVTGRRNILTVEDIVNKAFNSKILEQYKSASVCVDDNLTIIHAIGKLKRYINIPEDGFSSNLAKILPDNVLIPIQSGIRKLNRDKLRTLSKNVRVEIDNHNVTLKVEIDKISLSNYISNTFLITFLEMDQQKLPKGSISSQSKLSSDEVQLLKESLKETKENLQLTIEELETSNEEMQATNEELLAANEELQSTNEELQSVNEELHTVNAELQNMNTTLIELNTDIENLFKNIQVGTLFLDDDNCIRRFTPKIEEHFGFREEDLGRSITLYSGTSILGKELAEMADEVKAKGEMKQIEIKHPNGSWFWVEVFPYKDLSKIVRGVTVNFININKLKSQSDELKTLYSSLDELTNASPSIITVVNLLDKKTELVVGNPKGVLGVDRKEISNGFDINSLFLDDSEFLFNKHLEAVAESESENTVSKLTIKNAVTGEKKWITVSSKIHRKDAKGVALSSLNVIQDITPIVDRENELKSSEERYRLALTSQRTGLWECEDIKKEVTWWSEEYKKLLGYADEEYEQGYQHFLDLIEKDNYDDFVSEIETALAKSSSFSCLLKLNIKNEGYKWFEVNGFAERDKKTKADRVICSVSISHDKIVDRLIIESKQKLLENIFENAPIGLVIIDSEGIITESSTGFNKLIGEENEDVVGNKFINLEENDSVVLEFKRLVKFEFPFISFEKKYVSKNQERWCHNHMSPIAITNDEGVTETRYFVIVSDMTDKHNYKYEIDSINSELSHLNLSSSNLIASKLGSLQNKLEPLLAAEDKSDLEENLSVIFSHLDALSQHYELINTSKSFKNTNLNKLVKKLAEELEKSDIILTNDVLPGINVIESQIYLLLKELVQCISKMTEIKNNTFALRSESKKNSWVLFLSCTTKNSEISKLIKPISGYLEKSEGLDDRPSLQVKLATCRKIVHNHKGKIKADFKVKDSKLTVEFSLKS